MHSLLELITQARYCVVLTGAGISTLSGIPDFRGVGGLYRRKDLDANKLFDLKYFLSDPSYYYQHTQDFLYSLDDKAPSLVHRTLAGLEAKGLIQVVITQNIDLLHQKAGSRNVLELHGSPKQHHCLQCEALYGFEDIMHRVAQGMTPSCEICGGSIKPDIVFFGEMLPQDVLEKAEKQAALADLMLVLGTSLTVYPAAALPGVTLRAGGKLAIVNASPTHLDSAACWGASDLTEAFTSLQVLLQD